MEYQSIFFREWIWLFLNAGWDDDLDDYDVVDRHLRFSDNSKYM